MRIELLFSSWRQRPLFFGIGIIYSFSVTIFCTKCSHSWSQQKSLSSTWLKLLLQVWCPFLRRNTSVKTLNNKTQNQLSKHHLFFQSKEATLTHHPTQHLLLYLPFNLLHTCLQSDPDLRQRRTSISVFRSDSSLSTQKTSDCVLAVRNVDAYSDWDRVIALTGKYSLFGLYNNKEISRTGKARNWWPWMMKESYLCRIKVRIDGIAESSGFKENF